MGEYKNLHPNPRDNQPVFRCTTVTCDVKTTGKYGDDFPMICHKCDRDAKRPDNEYIYVLTSSDGFTYTCSECFEEPVIKPPFGNISPVGVGEYFDDIEITMTEGNNNFVTINKLYGFTDCFVDNDGYIVVGRLNFDNTINRASWLKRWER